MAVNGTGAAAVEFCIDGIRYPETEGAPAAVVAFTYRPDSLHPSIEVEEQWKDGTSGEWKSRVVAGIHGAVSVQVRGARLMKRANGGYFLSAAVRLSRPVHDAIVAEVCAIMGVDPYN